MVLVKLMRTRTIYTGFQGTCQVAYLFYVIVKLVKYLRQNNILIYDSNLAVDPKNTLESTKEDVCLNQTVKAPANLVVLEGDCLDASDNGELDSYLVLIAITNYLFLFFVFVTFYII